MMMVMTQEENINYDYQEILTKGDHASFLLESYQKLGWELESYQLHVDTAGKPQPSNVILRMKRNHKMVNKTELKRLQRNFEGCVREIDKMERNKIGVSSLTAITIGTLSAACLLVAGFMLKHAWIFLGGLLGIVGLAGCVLPVYIYREILEEQTEKFAPLIRQTYQEIEIILEKGNKLIY